ncbi:DUF5682 family protein [Derxia gummosa]|uniref:DUF5682 family protein n=1 Tax=Derxia gummosa DSM 723 TaxID=1121388 RepID=A0A8B6XA58_9BURK|nr:DUF5682 family protein [Derxia gummosa]
MTACQIYGIRHHGPGSARSLLGALDRQRPDVLLLEMPADAEAQAALATLAREGFAPPVALLLYRADAPQRCVYLPFANFSPEWQALRWAAANGVPVRLMDLPMALQLADAPEEEGAAPVDGDGATAAGDPAAVAPDAVAGEADASAAPPASVPAVPSAVAPAPADAPAGADPVPPEPDRLDALARLAGYDDAERWWDHLVETHPAGFDIFDAVAGAMASLREHEPPPVGREALREAFMRQSIRAARREKFTNLAVVCGAWHAPALANPGPAAPDAALLKGLPKAKIAACWIPWTHARLARRSGYGAGVEAPGWYAHLWGSHGQPARRVTTGWLARCAATLRERDIGISSGHVIEAVRLAEGLAGLRGRELPDLADLRDAITTVLGEGESARLALLERDLFVGDLIGEVPDDASTVPLLLDLQQRQKRLRLPITTEPKPLELDLRKPGDLDRSRLLHRLGALDIRWARLGRDDGRGSFRERWTLTWKPELAVDVVEAAIWGATVESAAAARLADRARAAAASQPPDLAALVETLHLALLADLRELLPRLVAAVADAGAATHDVDLLLAALPGLARLVRYGDVRNTDSALSRPAAVGLALRAAAGLVPACQSLSDEAALARWQRLAPASEAVPLLGDAGLDALWFGALRKLAEGEQVHGRLRGGCARIAYDRHDWSADDTALHMGRALSRAAAPADAAAWVEGFLGGSGLLLVHDDRLFDVLDGWVRGLSAEHFTAVLPLLRRAFSAIEPGERRQLGQRAARGGTAIAAGAPEAGLDPARAAVAAPVLALLLGAPLPAALAGIAAPAGTGAGAMSAGVAASPGATPAGVAASTGAMPASTAPSASPADASLSPDAPVTLP